MPSIDTVLGRKEKPRGLRGTSPLHGRPGPPALRALFGALVAALLGVLLAGLLAGCTRRGDSPAGGGPGGDSSPGKVAPSGPRQVVVYTALDRSFSEPIFERFTREAGIRVLPVYDVESTKTVGLANRIRAERSRPRCDVFWNNEIVNTIALESEGLLEPSSPPNAALYPGEYVDPDGNWYGFAARARVLIVNTSIVPEGDFPASIRDLASPRWAGKTGIAKPLFGTTASHVACLFAALGTEEAVGLLDALKGSGIQIHGGNKGCATSVGTGATAFALTDTDDAIAEVEAGRPVRIVYPDSGPDGMGTLYLPNTVAVVRGAPHLAEARELVNYLLSPAVERALAEGPSAQVPLGKAEIGKAEIGKGEVHPGNAGAGRAGAPRIRGPGEVRAMKVDFEKAAACFPEARKLVEERFLR